MRARQTSPRFTHSIALPLALAAALAPAASAHAGGLGARVAAIKARLAGRAPATRAAGQGPKTSSELAGRFVDARRMVRSRFSKGALGHFDALVLQGTAPGGHASDPVVETHDPSTGSRWFSLQHDATQPGGQRDWRLLGLGETPGAPGRGPMTTLMSNRSTFVASGVSNASGRSISFDRGGRLSRTIHQSSFESQGSVAGSAVTQTMSRERSFSRGLVRVQASATSRRTYDGKGQSVDATLVSNKRHLVIGGLRIPIGRGYGAEVTGPMTQR